MFNEGGKLVIKLVFKYVISSIHYSCYNSGCDAILLGAETLRGLYPVETISIVGRICAEVS